MSAHSRIGASSMYRWSECPGSVRLSAGIESKSSRYAEEGTEAHDLAARWLTAGIAPEFPDEEMQEAVKVYVDWVRGLYEPGDTLLVEQRFDLSAIHRGCFGTSDCVLWKPKQKLLIVGDYKHGAGIPVEVIEDDKINPQLGYYGLGTLITTKFNPERVQLTIVQPRCNHPAGPIRSHTIDAIDLLDFSADLKDYARATEDPDAPLKAGDHCRFCPASGVCPELTSRATEAAKMEFGPAAPYDPAKLKLALDSREIVKAWLKALDEFAYAEAEAGRTPLGYKLVAKRATRKWRSEGEVITFLQDAGIKDDVMFEPRSLKSPAQLEKAVDKKVLAEFTVAESSGHTLVPESDKRPPVKLSAADEFKAIE